jgi:pseudouridine-5'-phosphate glycosidase
MSTPHIIATTDTATGVPAAIAMEATVAVTHALPTPSVVDECSQMERQIRHLRQRLRVLRPALTAFVATLPSQSLDAGDSRIILATTRRSTSITRRFITSALADLLKQQEQGATTRSDDERDAIAAAMTSFIRQRRTVRTTQRLVRTWATARKRRADAIDMRD